MPPSIPPLYSYQNMIFFFELPFLFDLGKNNPISSSKVISLLRDSTHGKTLPSLHGFGSEHVIKDGPLRLNHWTSILCFAMIFLSFTITLSIPDTNKEGSRTHQLLPVAVCMWRRKSAEYKLAFLRRTDTTESQQNTAPGRMYQHCSITIFWILVTEDRCSCYLWFEIGLYRHFLNELTQMISISQYNYLICVFYSEKVLGHRIRVVLSI